MKSQKAKKEEAQKTLLVFCFDSVTVRDKTTFFSYLFRGLRVTHWFEDTDDEDMRIASIFDILFEEVMRRKSTFNPTRLKSKKYE